MFIPFAKLFLGELALPAWERAFLQNGVRARRVRERGVKSVAWSAALILLFSHPALSQGPMGPGGGCPASPSAS